ncbi:PAAR domain-containing protein [Massilia antarctica]|uniref:PAAR domain-containing protein n=1 Tax=Massilia antarctica TaxID=2765360 RepID=A0AA48WCK2_9BURK|nr:PAAR domain-containing protein [Massilia antarctica]QPI48775.1 PAAR domain-containing protein [Massilia antarctica]
MTFCAKHPQVPLPIATGSASVYINGLPAARVDDTIACSAVITDGPGTCLSAAAPSRPM